MSRKRRVFDINFDGDLDGGAGDVPAGTETGDGKRGPMAAAITENAEALTARDAAAAAIRAENDALAHEHVRLKKAGLITDLVPIDAVDAARLTRDRAEERDAEIDELKHSIRQIGLSNPIRVDAAGERFELIQGYRRLTAFRELYAETGDAAFARIPAVINARGEDMTLLYRRMVDENLVRRGVSFGELARLAMAYRDQDPNMQSYHQAVELIFASASRQKRSHIRSFVDLLAAVGEDIRFPQSIARALGQKVLRKIGEEGPETLRAMLRARPDRDEAGELAVLEAYLKESAAKQGPKAASGKTTFKVARAEGVAKCTAAPGRVELRLDRDFSAEKRARLEQAVVAFFDVLDG
ncbi:ParB/RepB/Spo0J family partition protein [Poseidonocella sedimentorum]|uniref:Chromosome partitioning protein, ParB family n=1 Tax=Poseidonocella sedimentorum TaxID=871652 RepID=A0A1I6EDJ7_9RHOB|nr:ParB N-terminal domain-containing protein [Poseidonocella sedimentorum]SFR15830.1 chromosome partitioning protein, ParB family [Poseidonocella sedimentorum]